MQSRKRQQQQQNDDGTNKTKIWKEPIPPRPPNDDASIEKMILHLIEISKQDPMRFLPDELRRVMSAHARLSYHIEAQLSESLFHYFGPREICYLHSVLVRNAQKEPQKERDGRE
jgi:hypothetical protein